jgi:phosphatase NudJ
MARVPLEAWLFAVVVVRKADRFLLVHERDGSWYLPAGRVEPGERFAEAARRETLEEAGVPIRLTGILRVEPSHAGHSLRLRVVFVAEPADDTPPKQLADAESLGAAWVGLDELERYPLRGPDVVDYLRYLAGGGAAAPLETLAAEGVPMGVREPGGGHEDENEDEDEDDTAAR